MDKRFEQVDKRIDELRMDMNRRFEQVDKRMTELRMDMNKRFEDMNKRFDSMLKIMLGIVAAFSSIVAVAIGFAIWDRRTMVRPFEVKIKTIEDEMLVDRRKLDGILEALKKYARNDKRLADLLKSLSLL